MIPFSSIFWTRSGKHHQLAVGHQGFTLLEMLAAITILVLLFGSITMILVQSQKSAAVTTRIISSQDSARAILDRMEQDLLSMGQIGGATLILGKSPDAWNDALAFVCSSRPVNTDPRYSNMRLAAVYYAIGANAGAAAGSGNTPALIRGFGPVEWDTSASSDPAAALASIASDASTSGTAIAIDSYPLGEGVIRCAVILKLQDGTQMPNDTTQSNFPKSTTFSKTLPSNFVAIDLSKVKAITISIAILDPQTRSRSSARLAEISRQLLTPTYSASVTDSVAAPSEIWSGKLTQPAFDNFDPSVRQYIQFSERTIFLH